MKRSLMKKRTRVNSINKFIGVIFWFLAPFCNYIFALENTFAQKLKEDESCIIINKKNVTHKFVYSDQQTDHFVKNIFECWEPETFEIFDKVKDPETIAIDLGSWIGTTSIWLSKNFYHVVAVDADPISLKCLRLNLKASECGNVTICERPIAQTSQKFIFGPRGSQLNESISYIKEELNESASQSNNDFVVRGLPFKQLIHDYIYTNDQLKSRKVSFIKCHIEGGEENIIEDLLHFAYYNKTKVYLSFHVSWWKSKKITDFAYLFTFFKTNCPTTNICEYINNNPFTSLLFEPLNNSPELLVKNNIPAIIIGYNQYTYIKNMVSQLEKYTSDILIIDNNSSFIPLLNYYENDFKYTLLKQKVNYGHTVYRENFIQNLVGDLYLLTDPDLEFNAKLPDNFIQALIEVSNYFGAIKVGFALCIDADDLRTDILVEGKSIVEFESSYWQNKLIYPANPALKLYRAPIDTTFCLVNKKYEDREHIRMAGDFLCLHLPWHKNFNKKLADKEYGAYLKNNTSTHWFKGSNETT